MADLKLTADFTDIQTLKRELLDIPKKARDSARTFEAEFAKAERALVKQAKQFERNAAESQKYYSQLLQLGRETKNAERSAEVFTRELEKQERAAKNVGRVFKDQTARAVRALAQEFARTGDQSAYLSGINRIVNSQKMLQTGSRTSRSEIMRLGNEFRQQAKFANELAIAQGQIAAATQRSNKGLARSGVVMQQTGYQVGDFLVQVQSGTNAFVAFGQQATQLAGLLTMSVNPKIVALGAGLSIVIPLLTAIAAGFMRTSQTSNSATGGFTTMEAAMKSAREESSRMADEIERLNLGLRNNTELNVRRAIEEQRLRVTQAQQLYEDVAGTDGGFAAEVRLQKEQEILKQYEDQLQKLQDQAQQIEDINKTREQESERAEEEERRALFLEEQLDSLTNQSVLYGKIARFGENSLQVERERARQARNAYEDQLRQQGVGELLVSVYMNYYDAMVQVREEAEKTTEALESVADMDLPLTAKVRALSDMLGIAADEALRLLNNLPVGTTYGARLTEQGLSVGQMLFGGMEGDIPKSRGRSAAGGQDPLQQLQQRLKLEQDLLGKTEAQRRVIQALGIDWRKYGDDTIEGLVALVEKLDETNRKIAEQQSIADTIKDSMSDAFMSMVDGTKTVEDAFKGMARAIIKQLYDVLVVQQLVGSFSAQTKTGTGIVGAIGSALFRESGGSMMAGRPYIVGERGPELVIPGRSGTVMNADLTNKAMGGESINIVNNINVTGGTDPAAIRQEVAKLMPQITNATKTAVIDARRRGGQMKAAFG